MEFVPALAMLALVKKSVDLLKSATNKDMSAVITILGSWLIGILVVWLFSLSDFADGIEVGSLSIGTLNAAGLVIVGLAIGSSAGVTEDFIVRKGAPRLIPRNGNYIKETELGAIALDTWVIVVLAFIAGLLVSKVFLC
jgi:hypothetical protein